MAQQSQAIPPNSDKINAALFPERETEGSRGMEEDLEPQDGAADVGPVSVPGRELDGGLVLREAGAAPGRGRRRSGCHGGDKNVYVLREEAGKGASWERAAAPPEFAGHVQASCCLEI